MIYFGWNNYWSSFLYLFYVIIIVQRVSGNSSLPNVSQELITKLYSKYKEAVEDDSLVSTRRLFTQNRQYKIHVNKLKQVNGFKRHNLMIKEEVKSEKNPLIYINNPVESKFPNAYLTLDEFKQALTNRILSQRETTKKLHLRMRNELITTRFISNQHSKMITKNPRNYIRSKSILATKLSAKVTLENVIAPNMNITNFTKIFTSNSAPDFPTTFEVNRETFKGEEILTTEPSKIYTDKITDAVTRSKESIENSTVTLSQANIDNFTTQDYPKTESLTDISDSSTVTVKINTESLNKTETFETESHKTHLEVATKVATSNESDISKNMSTVSTSLHTEDVTQKENSTEEVTTEVITEKEKTRDDIEILTEIVKHTTSITTRSTRRTLGRPLVFMGGN